MFSSSTALLAKTPYAALFAHNYVLERVFRTRADVVAITVERPGAAEPLHASFGDLQRDVLAAADAIVARLDAAGGGAEWEQAPRAADVIGLFDPKARAGAPQRYSCDVLRDDTAAHTAAMLFPAGYEYVVSLLALWALNLMAVPMSDAHNFGGELAHVLELSNARLVVGTEQLLEKKLPEPFGELLRSGSEAVAPPKQPSNDLFGVRAVLAVDSVIGGSVSAKQRNAAEANTAGVEVEEIGVAPEKRSYSTAADVAAAMREREEEAEAAKRAALEEAMFEDLRCAAKKPPPPSVIYGPYARSDAECVGFDAPAQLNRVFARRALALQRRAAGEEAAELPTPNDDCLMIFTSGTTAKPKGVVHTHASVANQVRVLQDAWRWSELDVILHCLPLHHIHGLVNVLLCSLASAARCVFTPFDSAARIARRLERGDITLFMAVPTIYAKLAATVRKDFSPVEQTAFRKGASRHVRLMVSGSAALPVPVLDEFERISGHRLLERYGMSEVGMALSQPFLPVAARRPGTVGAPLPTVECLLLSVAPEAAAEAPAAAAATDGDSQHHHNVHALALSSPSLFDRYFRNPAATRKELVVAPGDGRHFFATGDVVRVEQVEVVKSSAARASQQKAKETVPCYTILGRSSVDIIKRSGYKISALEIEAALLEPLGAPLADSDGKSFAEGTSLVVEAAVVGVSHAVTGEEIVAIVQLAPAVLKHSPDVLAFDKDGHKLPTAPNDVSAKAVAALLKAHAAAKLAHYKVPSRFVFVAGIPRNAMGKVNKKDLKKKLHL